LKIQNEEDMRKAAENERIRGAEEGKKRRE